MPELPEVQTVVNELRKQLIGQTIVDLKINLPKLVKNATPTKLIQTLVKASFERVDRVGKYIVFHFNNGWSLVSHLRMEGKYFFEPLELSNTFDPERVHLVFILQNICLCYYDSRQFGTFHLYKTSEVDHCRELQKVGIDPLDPKFNETVCRELLGKTNRNIKSALLDQSLISGLGNIYVNEVLFACKISPWEHTTKLTKNDFKNITSHVQRILTAAIAHHGTTIFSFQFAKGQTGSFQKKLQVHMRQGLPCYRCGTPIEKAWVSGRGTYYCPKCQVLK